MHSEDPYNPLDKRNLGTSVADALLAKPLGPLPPGDSFIGAGVYAIYYRGEHPLYRPISLPLHTARQVPIYVGKAVPSGARKGGFSLDSAPGPVLFRRLVEHAESIEQAGNLAIEDFQCRYLVVDDIWIPLGESLLIQMFAPVWNRLIEGFGNHDPGKGRHQGQTPSWDVLHPGRSWAGRLQPSKKSASELAAAVEAYFRDAALG
ncbi:MAG: Eco29kI family restriction endonuclease [Bryobacteraceae bacterium]|nr:Eco29kI family restriction endonuclease [Solibacteraceae bacterium]MCO5350882.1 Eco29kI family restriction endonuclease [Bryobacteraceae bacterium]